MTYVPNPDAIEFVDEVPPRKNPFPETVWLPVLERIKQRPNRPAAVGRFETLKEANKVANNLRVVTHKRGDWEINTRDNVVYVTYKEAASE